MTTRLMGVARILTGCTTRARIGDLCGGSWLKAFSTSRRQCRGRNLLAKYAPRETPASRDTPAAGSQWIHDSFTTIATQPVGPSFQTVPSPSSEAAVTGQFEKDPIPAMITPQSSSETPPLLGRMGERLDASQTRGPLAVQGITVPPKPRPPGEEECCMSGCVHCVYTIYADDLEEYTAALKSAKDALLSANVPKSEWPGEVMDVNEDTAKEEKAEVVQHLDPSMAAFLALEGKLKGKAA